MVPIGMAVMCNLVGAIVESYWSRPQSCEGHGRTASLDRGRLEHARVC